MISVAKCLVDLKNFNSLMGVLAGLGLVAVSRLKNTFGALPKKSNEKLRRLAQFQDPAGGFRFLRNHIKENGAVLPYLGIYLSDLVNIDENTELVEISGRNFINFYKHQLISKSIITVLQFATASLGLEKQQPYFTFLYDLPHLTENELYKMSLEREPRDAAPHVQK